MCVIFLGTFTKYAHTIFISLLNSVYEFMIFAIKGLFSGRSWPLWQIFLHTFGRKKYCKCFVLLHNKLNKSYVKTTCGTLNCFGAKTGLSTLALFLLFTLLIMFRQPGLSGWNQVCVLNYAALYDTYRRLFDERNFGKS